MLQFCLIEVTLIVGSVSWSNGFLLDTSTKSPSGPGLTDRHYYDLLDLIMEERRGRRKLEQYINGPLQIELKTMKNETVALKTTYRNLLSDNAYLQTKLEQLVNDTGSKIELHGLELQLNRSLDISVKEMHDLGTYLYNVSNNVSNIDTEINRRMTKIQQQVTESREMVAVQVCGGYPIQKQADWGTVYHWMGFKDIKSLYGLSDVSSVQTSGIFYCEKPGLYLVIASIMCMDSDSSFQIIRSTADRKGNLLSQVQIVPRYRQAGSDVTMYHSGTGSAVVKLNFNDTLYVEPKNVRRTLSNLNCLTIVKLK